VGKVPPYESLLKQWVPERVFDVGTTQAYSNYGASLAGYIVQRLSGEPFDDYIENHHLQAAGHAARHSPATTAGAARAAHVQ
jgi:CubicO group peptidase (beta-lactamase class C family)